VLKAFVENCLSLDLGHPFEYSWIEVSQADVSHGASPFARSQRNSGRRFSVTVSSNEAQHIPIQEPLCQQVLLVISPAG
jgi:hypothetical protein